MFSDNREVALFNIFIFVFGKVCLKSMAISAMVL